MPDMISACSKDKVFCKGTYTYMPGYDSFWAHHHLPDPDGYLCVLCSYHDEN